MSFGQEVLDMMENFKVMLTGGTSDRFDIPFYNVKCVEIYDGKRGKLYTSQDGKTCEEKQLGNKVDNEKILGHMTFKYENVPSLFSNPMGKLHGGAIATWVDIVTSIAIYGLDPAHRPLTVSVGLNVDYIGSGNIDEDLYMKAILLKSGKQFAFTECTLMDKDGRIIARG